jgi:hypothetical protein
MKAASRRQVLAAASLLLHTAAFATWDRAEPVIVTRPMVDATAAARS